MQPPGRVLPSSRKKTLTIDLAGAPVFASARRLGQEGKRVMSENNVDDAEETGESDGEGKVGVGKVARIMARSLWLVEWSAAHPDASSEERRAAWKEGTEGRSAKVKQARKAIKIMSKRGVTFIVSPNASADEEDDD
jgi:hypothetical protein